MKKIVHLIATLLLIVASVESVTAQSIAQRERIRRQGLTSTSERLLMEGREAYSKKDYQGAVDKYRSALSTLPQGPATESRRTEYLKHLSDGTSALAQDYRRTGKYDESRRMLEELVSQEPNNRIAKRELAYLDDPIRTNPSLTHEHTKNIDTVRRRLYKGEGFYNLGRYDAAIAEFQAVLRIDPYNKAARRWMERCNAIKSDYYRAAYDETRSRLLMEVDRAWEIAVPPLIDDSFDRPNEGTTSTSNSLYIREKLRSIIIPVVDFEDTPIDEAVDFLRHKSRELDSSPTDKGINFVIRSPRGTTSRGLDLGGDDELDDEGELDILAPTDSKKIHSLKLTNMPLEQVLQQICDQTSLRYKVDDFTVTLLPRGGRFDTDDIITRRWRVPPTFRSDLSNGSADAGGDEDDPFASEDEGGGSRLTTLKSMQELLEAQGIPFPEGTSAQYIASSSVLIVRNTVTNLDYVEAIVQEYQDKTPKQINILTKFVEISQENGEELGFDWVISPFNLGGEGFLGGGTQGSGTPVRSVADFTSVPGFNPITTGSLTTAANRTGQGAISRNNIDFILNNPDRTAQTNTAAPGILSLTGIFGTGSLQMIMRGLSQKKGVDVMTAPSITARSGQKANIEIIREFIYPTEYEPPQIPTTISSGDNGVVSSTPVTPATPTAFETRNTGVTLEIEPTIGANEYVIDLRFAPEIVEFEGFINYGSPILTSGRDALGNPTSLVVTENRIEMPVFSTRRVSADLTIYDGHTVAVGGLMKEDVQNVEDKVPILGDIPLIGRLFQTKAEHHIKSNLIVFVTARIIDATGKPIRGGRGTNQISDLPSDGLGTALDGGAGVIPAR